MKIFNSLEEFDLQVDTAITIGKFDGLHRGHKKLCGSLFSLEREGVKSLAISFIDSYKDLFSLSIFCISGTVLISNHLLHSGHKQKLKFDKMFTIFWFC